MDHPGALPLGFHEWREVVPIAAYCCQSDGESASAYLPSESAKDLQTRTSKEPYCRTRDPEWYGLFENPRSGGFSLSGVKRRVVEGPNGHRTGGGTASGHPCYFLAVTPYSSGRQCSALFTDGLTGPPELGGAGVEALDPFAQWRHRGPLAESFQARGAARLAL